jgi:hypothetical protein
MRDKGSRKSLRATATAPGRLDARINAINVLNAIDPEAAAKAGVK